MYLFNIYDKLFFFLMGNKERNRDDCCKGTTVHHGLCLEYTTILKLRHVPCINTCKNYNIR